MRIKHWRHNLELFLFKKITQDLKINLLGHDEECPVHAGLVTEGEYVKQIGSGEDEGTL